MEKTTGEVESVGTLPGRATTLRAKLRRQSQRRRHIGGHLVLSPFQDLALTYLWPSVFPVKLVCRGLVDFRGYVAKVGWQGGGMGLIS